MMTNRQHDELFIGAYSAVPNIEKHLANANALAAAKELHSKGVITDQDYKEFLASILGQSGYRIK